MCRFQLKQGDRCIFDQGNHSEVKETVKLVITQPDKRSFFYLQNKSIANWHDILFAGMFVILKRRAGNASGIQRLLKTPTYLDERNFEVA